MDIRLLLLLLVAAFVRGYKECPKECLCSLDERGRIQTICNRGGMSSLPIAEMDTNTEVLIIRGPRNDLTIGPIFLSLKKLEILRITDSNLPSVGTYSFWGTDRLRILDLSRNNITAIAQDNFKGQEHLDELDLSHNKINGLTSWVFANLKDLRRLSLANNLIEKLAHRVFYKVSKLKYLDVSGNPLTDLPPGVFTDIMELKGLKCRKCLLKEINSKLFQHVKHLTVLDLGENYIKHIDVGDFKDLKRLTKLHLDGNQLSTVVDYAFPTQKSLEFLDLSHNQLAKIPNDAFSHLSNLTVLDLSYNKIHKMMPGTVVPWKKLHTLNISGNKQLDLFPLRITFYNLRHLQALSIADMDDIPMDLLHSFDQLKVLNVSGNHFLNTSLTLLDSVSTLELLDLSRNNLNGFDDIQVWKLRQIKDVKLENNPLICDRCHMGALIEIAQTLSWNVYPICYMPERLRAKPISVLNVTTLDWCTEFDNDLYDMAGISENILLKRGNFNLFAIICAVGFITIAIIVLIIVLSVNRHSAKYYTNEDKRCDGLYEKNIDTLSITGNELNYKFPIDDIIYTIDESTLQSTTQPPLITSFTTRNGYISFDCDYYF
ncbi:insulin-like growth factor-binding protein complex acid labile subunit [Sitodiplosis mosellana]|uniref:insulin-like growth factor-binding protein complex acid labile subunit n=1 Tax=Sitodiplosis mosellana TaxID=263140 RepID=UPI0024450B06|nr:insulin-like growth factor-binding protein complex acid labile subunit [Sitodiplosis mosellana]XP_055295036.1 insulin-like growth factor-binding protein complex acid labile subunit [Sitodiplosis mosellana]XP_055295037.1 insulin-like growth factor-binding protein complex acid labile subunit [Sitodiplosis mosellana]